MPKSILHSVKLLLPALIPSWRFFDTIAPSPRIEFRLGGDGDWQEFRPIPAKLGLIKTITRLFWNAQWNESLYLTACAERLMANPTAHSEREIMTCIAATLPPHSTLQFRLAFISRSGDTLQKHITYTSPLQASS